MIEGSVENPEGHASRGGAGTPQEPRHQINFIQLLRGVAPLLVMWAHLSGFWLYANGRGWIVQDLWVQYFVSPFHLYQNAGHLGIVLFFLISGYIITHTSLRESRSAFATKRALRIFPALAVTVLVAFWCIRLSVAQNLGPLPGLQDGGPWSYVKAATLIDKFAGSGFILGQTWTLAIEVVFYGITLALIPLSKRNKLRATWLMVGFYAAACSTVLAVPELVHLKNTAIYLGFLILGRIFYLGQQKQITSTNAITAGLATSLLFVLFDTSGFPGELMTPSVEPAASYAIAILAFLALMQSTIRRVHQPWNFFGDISYSLYLLHLPIGMFTIAFLSVRSVPFSITFALACCASIGCAYVSYRWVEMPCQRLARRITGRPRRKSDPTRASRLAIPLEPGHLSGVGEVGIRGEALAVDASGR